jgi:enamine deaminase RidA (YjgF/YER057c/UK114 family)
MSTNEARFAALKLTLPSPKPMAIYATAVRHGDTLYTSGHGPLRADGTYITGRLGADLDVAAGKDAARQTGLAVLATVKEHLGSLDRVKRVIKVLGMVNATPEFGDHPQVINGFSELMVQVFGDAGLAARSAVGMAGLPAGIAVEVEAIFEVAP